MLSASPHTIAADDGKAPGGGSVPLGRRCWEAVAEPVLSVLFPPRCVGCGEFEVYLCGSCRARLEDTGADPCPRCGEPGARPQVAGRCAACMGRELEFAGARSAFVHQGVARSLVAQFKFGGQPVLGRLMADLAGPAFSALVESIGPAEESLVTWVPAYKTNKRRRGYNQAEILARRLVERRPGLSCAALAVKTTGTKQQKGLGRADRQNNLQGAFALPEAALRAALSVTPTATAGSGSPRALILVDDVYTTGATAAAVSSVLTARTGLPVYVFTFSRTLAAGDEGHD